MKVAPTPAGAGATEVGRLPPATHRWLIDEMGYPPSRLENFYAAAARPAATGIRINTLAGVSRDRVLARLAEEASVGPEITGRAVLPEGIEDMILFPNCHDPDLEPEEGLPAFVISRLTAEAVMQGAEPYAPGVAASPNSFDIGMRCNLYGDAVDMFKSRGVTADHKECLEHCRAGRLVFVGVAETLQTRAQTFGLKPKGQALGLISRVHSLPSLNNVLPDLVMLHGFPSSLVGYALGPKPGDSILDMCSSPGGKTCHAASLMKNSGSVTAVDRTANKIAKIKQQASRFGLTNIRTVVADSTEALPARSDGEADAGDDGDDDGNQQPELYDRVILDPTCSALGIRPRLSFAGVTPDYLKKTAAYQRKLMHAAVAALKPGGTLVYSTCTINPLENEGNVAWALTRFPELRLRDLGIPSEYAPRGLPIAGLSEDDAGKVARYEGLANAEDLFTGFFIACFAKESLPA